MSANANFEITGHKEGDEQVRILNEELEQRVKDRTAELNAVNCALLKEIAERKQTEVEFLRACHAAEEANRAKSTFLANMSHEIRTPMNGIIGLSHLVKQTTLTLKQSDYVSKIDTAAHRLLGTINDILDFSKVEAGKIELEHIEFNLEEVLSQLDQSAAAQALRKSIDFKISVAEGTPMMLAGDPTRLGQVLLNLTSNAIKFTTKGEVEVCVALLKQDDAHIALRFKVRDTGIGIDPLHIDKLFDPFSQSDSSTTRCFGGTGLGLAISKRFVQLMGGALEVRSLPGQGATFAFTARFGAASSAKKSSAARRGLLSDLRALVIDDNASSRKQTTDLLSQLSIKTAGADSCVEASRDIMSRSKAGAQGYDLVFVDCSTMGNNCLEHAKLMRLECATARMPPMILIASPDMADMQIQLNDAGFGGFLIKPIRRSSLFDVVVRVLSKKGPLGKDSGKTKSYPSLRGARILLVEDNEINQEIAADILKMAECEVVATSNGADALAILEDAAPDSNFAAVLMDIQMPGLDGCATTQLIRADKRYERTPIIAMTADAVSGVRERCFAAGMNDYLTKPVNPDQLYATLNEWIGP